MATKTTAKAAKSTGTAVAVKKTSSTAVVNIQEMLKKQAEAMSERTAPPSGINIRVSQDKQFLLPNGQKADELQIVIVDFMARNEFYEGVFDPNNISPPACFAIGSNPTKLVPSANSPAKQCDDCASCPMNAFGSAGKGKACKNGRQLAVIVVEEGVDPSDAPIWLLKVSPTGLKGFDGYIQGVARTFQMPPVAVVTSVTFEENVTWAQLKFSDAVPNNYLNECFARQDEARTLLEQEPDVSQYEAPKPTKAPARRPAVAGRR